ncbi:MAG TPA: hypothetical protein VF516_23705 [Kofleriaceae bacterium]
MGGRRQDEGRVHQEMTARTFLIALVAAGCASGARVDNQPASTVRDPMDTISTLKEVCEVLTRDPLSPAAAREALGRSGAAWVRAGRVIAAVDAPEPNHVELDLPAPVALEAGRLAGHDDDRPRPPRYRIGHIDLVIAIVARGTGSVTA